MSDSDVHISLPKNQVWTGKLSVTRSGNVSYVSASVDSVYPTSGTDNFEKVQARVVNAQGNLIMSENYVVIKEGTSYQKLYIKDGYLNEKTVYLQFRGNTDAAAEAVVNYLGN